jgi:xylan 1,4-beta-xylosidase
MRFGQLRLLVLSLLVVSGLPQSHTSPAKVVIDRAAPGHPWNHFWEQMFGSGRAILALRESYRSDLREVKKVTEFRYLRFHAILHDEIGIYDEDSQGRPSYNFSYVDQIYDGLLANQVRPFVEISFMPNQLAAREDVHVFWYKPIVSPPKDYGKWDGLMRALAKHLIDRYGIDEVAQWYFEVWNEPNIDFWSGNPKQATYFELYDHTARALKSVDPRLRVGGPATAAAHWVDSFLKHVASDHVPIDFVSTHGYADDRVEDLFGTSEEIPLDRRVCLAIKKVHDQIAASPLPNLPLMWTEWNVAGANAARDTVYVGPALADDIRQCDGWVNMMSFWTFSDVFEENGPKKKPFDGGFGVIAMGGIKKPSYSAFRLLHKLGSERIDADASNVLATRTADGRLEIAAWNLVDPPQQGSTIALQFEIKGVPNDAVVHISRADAEHGNTLAAYESMGSPQYPTPEEVEKINRIAEDQKPESLRLANREIGLEIPVNGLLLLEVEASSPVER